MTARLKNRLERLAWFAMIVAAVVAAMAHYRTIGDAFSFIAHSPAFPLWRFADSGQPYAIGIGNSLAYTFARVVLGTVVGFANGVMVGVVASQFPYFGRRLNAIFLLLAPLAPIIWMPFFMILTGIGEVTCLLTVALGSVFVAAIVAYYLATNVRQRYFEILAVMGASPMQVLRFVTFPSMAPMLLLLLRLNFFAGWMAVLAAEMAGIDQGLGTLLMLGRSLGNTSVMLLAALLIAMTAIALDRSIIAIARVLVARRYGAWLFLR
ncbi:MAG TPA: ABC transporter permease subunit [Phycisphaerae bacterium]|nr:ABC transporter permease subunit [Phycisphaerae bacterium]